MFRRPDSGIGRLLLGLALLVPLAAAARPEKVRPGHTYYSDGYVLEGLVRDIAAEKNYEEVYQFYRYYEAVYDEAERVVTFREYVRGELILTEAYRYNSEGVLLERTVKRPGKPDEVTSASHDTDQDRETDSSKPSLKRRVADWRSFSPDRPQSTKGRNASRNPKQ